MHVLIEKIGKIGNEYNETSCVLQRMVDPDVFESTCDRCGCVLDGRL